MAFLYHREWKNWKSRILLAIMPIDSGSDAGNNGVRITLELQHKESKLVRFIFLLQPAAPGTFQDSDNCLQY